MTWRVLVLLVLLAAPVAAQDFPPELPPFQDPYRVLSLMSMMAFDEPRDEAEIVDVLIVCTAAAKCTHAGTQALVTNANLDYERSAIRGRLRWVGLRSVSYVESTRNPLTWMSNEGYDEVMALRNQHSADIVVMIPTNNACGQGYVNASTMFPFAQCASSCCASNRSFSHEIGHLLGAHHEPQNVCGQETCTGDNYGHFWADGRTIMTYPRSLNGVALPRRGHFSNPLVLYNGSPTGITGQRDNARVINATFARVAGFKPAQPIAPYPTRPLRGRVSTEE
jgi:hypothetical protein